MRQYHKPDDEKRMVVVLDENDYDAWLVAPVSETRAFLLQFPSNGLVAETAQRPLP
jgi:putative SOS response-associated peptidase YedK